MKTAIYRLTHAALIVLFVPALFGACGADAEGAHERTTSDAVQEVGTCGDPSHPISCQSCWQSIGMLNQPPQSEWPDFFHTTSKGVVDGACGGSCVQEASVCAATTVCACCNPLCTQVKTAERHVARYRCNNNTCQEFREEVGPYGACHTGSCQAL